jgi:citrate synthase
VDFYSGGVLYSLGLPVDFFPAFFAVARMTGWCAHYIEEEFAEAQPKAMLYRPRADYIGDYHEPNGLPFIPIEERHI